jgi:hypothetical protein
VTTKEHLSKHDREIAAIRKLILLGMKLINLQQQESLKFRKDLRELQQAQKRTDSALRNFIESRTNGHTRRKVDLQ